MTTPAVIRHLRALDPRRALPALVTLVLALAVVFPARAADGPTGEIAGNISNAATGNLLEGARVDIPQLGLTTLTDRTGRFVFIDVPAGTYEVAASYLGLDPIKAPVTVNAGQRAARNFDLTTGIYQLETFKVAGEREGNAAAITAQRNAPNVKNIVALDAFGNLPNMNASELAVLLPGVAGTVNDEGNYNAMSIRGIPNDLNTITIDGALMGSQGGSARATRMHTITGSMFDSLELIKGHTPDKGADSLGGTINLKSRSPLSMKEKRRISYNLSARWAPPFAQHIPMREQHRTHPLLNVAYQEVFSAFGGDRNLGVAVNLFYSEQATGYFNTIRNFQSNPANPNGPAFLFDYTTEDNYNNRKQGSINVKVDYQLSPNTKLSLNTIYNDAMERFRLRYDFHAFAGTATEVPNATTSHIVPGFTDRITEIRAVAGSNVDIVPTMSQFYHRQRHVAFDVEHKFGPLNIDYGFAFSPDHINGTGGDGGVLTMRNIAPVGWILDRTQSDLYPRFIQTSGPDLRQASSYRPNSLTFNDNQNYHEPKEFHANFLYKLPTRTNLSLKAGARWREEQVEDRSKNRTYTFTGVNGAQLPLDPTIQTFGDHKSGLNFPQWNANAISRNRTPVDLSLWSFNAYAAEAAKFTGSRGATETVKAGYVMAQGSIGRTGFLAGIRREKTEDESFGWVRTRLNPSTAAEQLANPVAAAQKDFAGTRRDLKGNYTKSFPSVHLTHDFTRNLKGRLSWSNSFGRPPLSTYFPSETANDAQRTVTLPNLNLKPETSENWDTSLEYYFEPVGTISVGWFHKTIKDYFITGVEIGRVGTGADNGYNGDYPGYAILSRANLGTAFISGWEINYVQQFTFLPGLLKGFGVSANFTALDTHGNFGGTVQRTTGQVPGFIPHSGNVSLSWRYHKFSTRVTVSRVGEYIRTFTAAGAGGNEYTRARKIVNLGVAYQLRPNLSLTADVSNLFNEPQSWWRGTPDQMSRIYINGTTMTFGVSGRF
ncbi:MAG TPA: TonB-dependent receptor [Opitutaceae bacterium]|nr:TonB-dependent receptor [Opitutaceae bacterium]